MTKNNEALTCDQSNLTNIFSAQLDDSINSYSSHSSNYPSNSRKPDKSSLRLDLKNDQNGFICDQGPITCPEHITRSESNMSFNLPCTSLE